MENHRLVSPTLEADIEKKLLETRIKRLLEYYREERIFDYLSEEERSMIKEVEFDLRSPRFASVSRNNWMYQMENLRFNYQKLLALVEKRQKIDSQVERLILDFVSENRLKSSLVLRKWFEQYLIDSKRNLILDYSHASLILIRKGNQDEVAKFCKFIDETIKKINLRNHRYVVDFSSQDDEKE